MTLVALVRKGEDALRRVLVSNDLNMQLNTLFSDALHGYLADEPELVEFDGRLRADDSQLLTISNFSPPSGLEATIEDPIALEALNAEEDLPYIVGLLKRLPNDSRYVPLQSFDSRQVFAARGLGVFLSGNTFEEFTKPSFVVREEVDAVYDADEQRLLFRSFARVRHLFDMKEAYREATQADLGVFCELPRVLGDPQVLEAMADSWVRRKLAFVVDTGMLSRHGAKAIAKKAAHFGLTIETAIKDGTPAIVLPGTKKELKHLLRFLDDDYYAGTFGDRKYVSNSKRTIIGE